MIHDGSTILADDWGLARECLCALTFRPKDNP